MPTMLVTQPIPTIVREEEEKIAVPAKELDRYILSSSAGSVSCHISKHLEVVHEHLSGTYLTDFATSAQLQKSLIRVTKSTDSSMAPEVKKAC